MRFNKLRVFLVEDDSLIAMLVEDMLEELGCELVATAQRVADALQLLPSINPDFALLDVSLAGERVFPVAAALATANIPFAFTTGYGGDGLPAEFKSRPVITKPFQLRQLADIMSSAVEC